MPIVIQIIVAALLFFSITSYFMAKLAFREVRLAWYLVLAASLWAGRDTRPKFKGMSVGFAAFCRSLAAALYCYSLWSLGKVLIILVALTWKILVAL